MRHVEIYTEEKNELNGYETVIHKIEKWQITGEAIRMLEKFIEDSLDIQQYRIIWKSSNNYAKGKRKC